MKNQKIGVVIAEIVIALLIGAVVFHFMKRQAEEEVERKIEEVLQGPATAPLAEPNEIPAPPIETPRVE